LLVVKYANLDQVLVVDSIRVEGTKVIGIQIEESGKTDHILGTYASAALAKAAIPSLIVSPSMENAPIVEAKTDNTAGNLTITAAMVLAGILERDPAGADRTDTLPTAALLVAGVPGGAFIGQAFELLIANKADAAEKITVAAGTGGTLKPTFTPIIQWGQAKKFLIVLTNVTSGTEAYSVYAVNETGKVITTATADATAGNLTITPAMVLAGILERDPAAANRSDVFPTAELLVAAIPNAFVGKTLDLLVVNTADAAETIAIAAGTGGTLKPGTPGAFGQNKSVLYRFLLTNVSAGTEAYTVYAVTGL
jgi:hypothetical protein